MKRREFLKKTAATAAFSSVVPIPAIAQSLGQVSWRMTASWPKNLEIVYGSADALCKRVSELTEGKFKIQLFAAGEIVGGLQVYDAVQAGSVEMGHTLSSFYIGKRPALAFDTGLPFGLNYRQHTAWMEYGGGRALIEQLCAKDRIFPLTAGNVGVQMGGFYRKEINTPDDLKGLKIRIGGFGGMVMAKLGAVPQQLPPGDIYAALERGTIDAAELIGPYDDEKLGLFKVAKYYYTPGWWEGSASITAPVNLERWNSLPKLFQLALQTAANEQNLLMMARYDAENGNALRRMVAGGAVIKTFSREVLHASYDATTKTLQETADKDADFKNIYEKWRVFLDQSDAWFRVAEAPLDTFRYYYAKK